MKHLSQHYIRVTTLVLALGCCCVYTSRIYAVVLTFDDQSQEVDLTGSGYANINWELGNPGVADLPGHWVVARFGNFPSSPPANLVNATGATLMGFGFPSAVNMGGGYVARQGNTSLAQASSIRVHGFREGTEVAVSPWFSPITSTPAWFDMSSLTNVDRVVFESVASYQNQGYYGLDDLTFTYIPEPGSLAMIGLAGAGLLARRRRHK